MASRLVATHVSIEKRDMKYVGIVESTILMRVNLPHLES